MLDILFGTIGATIITYLAIEKANGELIESCYSQFV